jgi:hypothetical protein
MGPKCAILNAIYEHLESHPAADTHTDTPSTRSLLSPPKPFPSPSKTPIDTSAPTGMWSVVLAAVIVLILAMFLFDMD